VKHWFFSCLIFCLIGIQSAAAAIFRNNSGNTISCSDFDVTYLVADFPEFRVIKEDNQFNEQFGQYMNWLSSLGVPDARLVVGYMNSSWCSIDRIASIFHEKIELREWMLLGHKFQDIIDTNYYQAHYEQVYPIAHRKAMASELALLTHFAGTLGVVNLSELSFVVVNPLIEEYSVDVARFVKRLRFNHEILDQRPTCDELERAAMVFENGGYVYTNREKILRKGCNFLQFRYP